MRYKPKVCILSASIGQGHVQAARAVAEAMKRRPEGYRMQTLDFLSRDMISFDYWVRETYIKMIDLFPLIYDVLYHQSQRRPGGGQVRSLIARMFRSRMRHLVGTLAPEALIFTHPFPAAAASRLAAKGELKIPLVAVVTDFDCHQLWVYDNMSAYCVPSETVRDDLVAQGVDPAIVHVTGIPIMRRFYKARNKVEREPGTVLIMGGGLGLGAVTEALWRLTQVREIRRFIVVCGQNMTLYDEVDELRKELRVPVELYGYTNEIPNFMARAELLVTKPGALTCTEAMTMGLPMVLVSAIPGQEEANARYLESVGMARRILNEELIPTVRGFFSGDLAWGKHRPPVAKIRSAAAVAEVVHQLFCERNGSEIRDTKEW